MPPRISRWAIVALLILLASSAVGFMVRAVMKPHSEYHSYPYITKTATPRQPTIPSPSDAVESAGKYYVIKYNASKKPGELSLAVTYTLWVPETPQRLRGIIVHQHGCGSGACKSGEQAAYDLHWQALAAKWDCALLAPRFHQSDSDDCRLWCDPRKGSRAAFLKCLNEFAVDANRPEISTIPWCLWGHSGGGVWCSLMMASDPERSVACWLRSGTAFGRDAKEFAPFDYPNATYGIPVVANPGAKEKDDKRFAVAYSGSVAMHKHFRAKNAPFALAVDPITGHECGNSRYLAIPWFNACLRRRLPAQPGLPLKQIGLEGGTVLDGSWLPDATVAAAYQEYVKTALVKDTTPPPAPTNLAITINTVNNTTTLTWEAVADLESGLSGFIIERYGREIARLPQKAATIPRPCFQGCSYHDTPELPLPKMTYTHPGSGGNYRIIAVNGAGLKSKD